MSRRTRRIVALLCCAAGAVLAAPAVSAAIPVAGDPDEVIATVTAVAESPVDFDDDAGGNADSDDPAIWRNDADPAASLIVASAKEGGLRVFDLDGRLVQSLAPGPGPTPDSASSKFNNVDIVHGMPFPDGPADVAVASDRGRDRVRFFRIDPADAAAPLTDVTAADQPLLFSANEEVVEEQDTAYGLAAYEQGGRFFAVVSGNALTAITHLELEVVGGTVAYTQNRTIDLPATFPLPDGTTFTPCDDPGDLPQVEGMVHDPSTGTVYAAQEAVGIWQIPEDLTGTPELIDTVREFGIPAVFDAALDECIPGEDPGFGGENISADVEGLTIYDEGDGEGFLIASSQGDNTFAVYGRMGDFETAFRVADGAVIDGSEECDGAAVSSESFGDRFPDGILVVQDGSDGPPVLDEAGEPRDGTNFKIVNWTDVEEAADLD